MIATDNIKISKVATSKISELDFDNIQFGKTFSDHMFESDYINGQWINSEVKAYQDLVLNPATLALHYGQTIFEGMKAYKTVEGKSVMFRPYKNFERFNKSAERMCMATVPEEVFMGGLHQLLSLDKAWIPTAPGSSLYLRPFSFATDPFIGMRASDTYKFMVFACPAGLYYSAPVKVKIETKYSRAVKGGTGYAKTGGNYSASMLPNNEAMEAGYQQLIWTDAIEHKYIEESGTMNVFFVINDVLITAPVSDTILDGVTRDSVITLAKDLGYVVEERRLSVEELVDAMKSGNLQEAFGAGTAASISHISEIGYEGKDYMLPAVEHREISPKILTALNEIKTGRREDKFDWLYHID